MDKKLSDVAQEAYDDFRAVYERSNPTEKEGILQLIEIGYPIFGDLLFEGILIHDSDLGNSPAYAYLEFLFSFLRVHDEFMDVRDAIYQWSKEYCEDWQPARDAFDAIPIDEWRKE